MKIIVPVFIGKLASIPLSRTCFYTTTNHHDLIRVHQHPSVVLFSRSQEFPNSPNVARGFFLAGSVSFASIGIEQSFKNSMERRELLKIMAMTLGSSIALPESVFAKMGEPLKSKSCNNFII